MTMTTKASMSRYDELRERKLSELREALDEGLQMSDMARKWGVTLSAVSNFLARNDRALRRAFHANSRPGMPPVSNENKIARLRILKQLNDMGLSVGAFRAWCEMYAPDGADDALAELLDDE